MCRGALPASGSRLEGLGDITDLAVARYYEYVQKTVDFNRDLAAQWAELFSTLSGFFREQTQQVTGSCRTRPTGSPT